jgi:hypothetical protein
MTGCQKLDDERTFEVGPGKIRSMLIDPPTKEQKVTVTISSSISPVTVYVVPAKEQEAAERAMESGKQPNQSFAGKEKSQEATLEATIPANTGYAIIVGGAIKDSQVKVKVTGR